MNKISFENFERVMTYNFNKNKKWEPCIEVYFSVDGDMDYQDSWLGKLIDRDTKKSVYWFGLVEDGSEAYDFDSFEEFSNAKVFKGKSIKEIWDSITIDALSGGEVEEMLPFYLSQN